MKKHRLSYFGKYLCECGFKTSDDKVWEIHQLQHLAKDISEKCDFIIKELGK